MLKTFNKFYNSVRYLSLKMSHSRYFVNPKPDFETEFGHPQIPEDYLKNSVGNILTTIEQNLKPVEKNGGDGIYLGTAGVAYTYYHLSKIPSFNNSKVTYLNKALEYLKPALSVAYHAAGKIKEIPSFVLGPCGVYAVAAAIFHATGDEKQRNKYLEMYHKAASICKEVNFLKCGSDELFVGRAGYVLGAVWLAKETNTPLNKNDVYEICNIIVESGREYSRRHKSQSPLMYSYYQVEYLGAAHGLSSILQVLLSVPGYIQANPAALNDIKASIDYLLTLQDKNGNFPAAVDEAGHRSELVHWCHGAGGVVYLMAKAYLVFKEPKYLESCKIMSDLVWEKGLLKKGPGICHGVAGNGYVFLLLYRLTQDVKYLYRAVCFAQFIDTEAFKDQARIPDYPYSLYEGIAGTACFLGDLMSPNESVFPFSDVF